MEGPKKAIKRNKRVLTGIVVSDKPDKTIVVSCETMVKHPLYKKIYKKEKKNSWPMTQEMNVVWGIKSRL